MNQLAGRCGLASRYSSITHPAIANDVGALTGDPHGLVHNSCAPCTTTAASLLSQVQSWRAFVGGMPTPCRKLAAPRSGYSRLSNPPTYLDGPRVPAVRPAARHDLQGSLQRMLAANTLPAFSLVVPDGCADTSFNKHCGGTLKRARVRRPRRPVAAQLDAARSRSSPAYQSGSTVIFVTWNQAVPAKPLGAGCTAPNALPEACQVPLLVISPYVKSRHERAAPLQPLQPAQGDREAARGAPLLGHAGDVRAGNLVGAFGL